jgi:hypothetical protein
MEVDDPHLEIVLGRTGNVKRIVATLSSDVSGTGLR